MYTYLDRYGTLTQVSVEIIFTERDTGSGVFLKATGLENEL